MSADANKALVYQFVDAFNRGDLAAIDQFIADDYVDHSRPGPGGPAGVRQFYTMMHAAFPDISVTIEDAIAEGDKVAVRFTVRGTHQGELMGIPASGRSVTLTGIDINRFANGRLVERWANQDDLGFMQQLGVLPAPETAAR